MMTPVQFVTCFGTFLALCLAQVNVDAASYDAKGYPGYLGCFADKETRDVDGVMASSTTINTPKNCISYCTKQGFKYAAVQYGKECFCGKSYGKYGASTGCNVGCTGDSSQICGGFYANSVYSIADSLVYYGCYADKEVRDLPQKQSFPDSNTPAKCSLHCSSLGFRYAAVQFSSECFCGNSYGRYGVSTGCTGKCSGDSSQMCGGWWANGVYSAVDTVAYIGCFLDKETRDLGGKNIELKVNNTPAACKKECASLGFKYAAVQFGFQCFCGNSYGSYGKSDGCTMACSGDKTQTCGGFWANAVYAAKV